MTPSVASRSTSSWSPPSSSPTWLPFPSFRTPSPSTPSACPPRPRRLASPAGDSAQSGLASATRRRMRSTACARVSSWVGARMSMWASWSTRSSRWTSSPSSHRQAAASVKWVRATHPSRIGLLASRSSSRASESSAAASGPASFAHGSGSGNWVLGCKALITLRGIAQTEAITALASVIARSGPRRGSLSITAAYR